MTAFPSWLSPNGRTSSSTIARIGLAQAALVALLWWLHPPQPIPYPADVLKALGELLANGLLFELWTSFLTNLEALGIASLLSLALAYLTVIPSMRPIAATVAAARNFGVTGFVVLFTVAMGAGHGLRVALLTFCMVPFFVSTMVSVVEGIPKAQWDHARVLRMSGWRAVWEVVVLGQLDQALEALRQNAAMGWMALTMVEGLSRSEGGLGVMMLDQNKHFNMAAVFAIQGTIFVVGMGQDVLLGWVRRVLCPYADLERERT